MHYVLVWWFKEIVVPKQKGYAGIVVYADDFVCCFQYKEEATQFYERLKHRMVHFGLELEEEKSRLIEFGRFAEENCRKRGTKPETFNFLGFGAPRGQAPGGQTPLKFYKIRIRY